MAIERELGITHGLLDKWKRKLKDEGVAAFPSRGHLTLEQEKIRELERKLAIAEQERDILKTYNEVSLNNRKQLFN
jgi:transposase-like protein